MKTHTRRQLSAWIAWMEMEMNNPNRGDWYLMQITAEIQRLQLINVRSKSLDVDINHLKLKMRPTERSTEKSVRSKGGEARHVRRRKQDLQHNQAESSRVASQEDSRTPEEIAQEQVNQSKSIWLSYSSVYKSRIDMKDEKYQKFNRQDF